MDKHEKFVLRIAELMYNDARERFELGPEHSGAKQEAMDQHFIPMARIAAVEVVEGLKAYVVQNAAIPAHGGTVAEWMEEYGLIPADKKQTFTPPSFGTAL